MNSKLNTLFAILSVSIIFLSIVLVTQWEKIEELEGKVALIEAVMVRVGLTERIPASEGAGSPGAALPQ